MKTRDEDRACKEAAALLNQEGRGWDCDAYRGHAGPMTGGPRLMLPMWAGDLMFFLKETVVTHPTLILRES